MEEVATNTRPPPHSPLGPSSASRHRPPDAAGQPEFVPPCRFRLPPRPSRLKASEGSIKDKNRWLNNHFNSRRTLDFSVLRQAVTEATRPLSCIERRLDQNP
uniref:Uncharacterized protein n=1 Tax=Oryza punctata TaxID=4537 RepID=A0A0E0JPR8_ORYPU